MITLHGQIHRASLSDLSLSQPSTAQSDRSRQQRRVWRSACFASLQGAWAQHQLKENQCFSIHHGGYSFSIFLCQCEWKLLHSADPHQKPVVKSVAPPRQAAPPPQPLAVEHSAAYLLRHRNTVRPPLPPSGASCSNSSPFL